jgi:hypothetical protein
MKVKLQVRRGGGVPIYEGTYDVSDAASFGKACADVWNRMQEQQLAKATSIGELYDRLDDRLVRDLLGAEISLSRA